MIAGVGGAAAAAGVGALGDSTLSVGAGSGDIELSLFGGSLTNATIDIGASALTFNYNTSTTDSVSSAEIRFTMDRSVQEFSLKFTIAIPSNFQKSLKGSQNDKFWEVWGDEAGDYSGATNIGGQWRPKTDNDQDYARSSIIYNKWADPPGTLYGVGENGIPFVADNIVPADIGTTVDWVFYAKLGTSYEPSAGDTQMTWYKNGVLHHDTGASLSVKNGQGGATDWNRGYFMGWHQGYQVQTTFTITDWAMSEDDPVTLGWIT